MKSMMYRIVPFCLLMFVVGCEWSSSGSDGSWDDSYSWVNFSGLYLGINSPIVGGFVYTTAAGSTTDSTATTTGTVVNNEAGGTATAFQTIITGTLGNHPGIVPGSVTIVFSATVANGSSGSFTDDGSGGLSGSVNLVGPDPSSAQPATGTINYTTGVWTLNLTSPGLLTDATITVSYSYDSGLATTSPTAPGGISIAGGQVDTMLVQQVGNRLFFRDSNGNTYEGTFSVVSTAGGDASGGSAGAVTGSYEVTGTPAGQAVTISGTFTGTYTPPNSDTSSGSSTPNETHGQLASRTIVGIWMQPSGTANVNGRTTDLDVAVTTTTTETP
jgi:hypothetical protein